MKLKRLTLCIIILLVTASSCPASDVYYIKQINNNIYYNKGSWPDENSTQAESLNSAINHAQQGDEVYISSGDYKITSTITLKPGVKLYGSFDALTENTPNERKFNSVTSIDAKKECRVIECKSETANNADTRLDGFVIANGKLSDKSDKGAGMYNDKVTITIANCVFINNILTGNGSKGAGIYNNKANITIINCAFISNQAKQQGGAIYNDKADDRAVNIINCSFIQNKTTDTGNDFRGGAIYNNNNDNKAFELINCLFFQNSSYIGGGLYNSKTKLTSKHCTFINNTANQKGSEIYNQADTDASKYLIHSITDTIIFNNNASQAGIYNNDNNNLDFKNCALNVSIDGGQVTSSDIIYLTSLDLNNLQEVKINGVPHVILNLDKSSVLVNAGVSCDVSLDQLGQPRGLKVDIGSFEYQPEFLPEVVTNDFMNINNAIISLDLLMSMGSFDVEFKDIADKIEFTGIISPDWLAFNQISPLQGRFTFVDSPDDGMHTIFMNLTNALGVKEYNFTFTVKSKDEESEPMPADDDNVNNNNNDNQAADNAPDNFPSPVADDTSNNYDYNNNDKHDDEAAQNTPDATQAQASDNELNIDNGLSSEDYNNFDDNNGENNNEDNDPRTTDSDGEAGDINIDNNTKDEDNSDLLPSCGINLNLPLACLMLLIVPQAVRIFGKNKGRQLLRLRLSMTAL